MENSRILIFKNIIFSLMKSIKYILPALALFAAQFCYSAGQDSSAPSSAPTPAVASAAESSNKSAGVDNKISSSSEDERAARKARIEELKKSNPSLIAASRNALHDTKTLKEFTEAITEYFCAVNPSIGSVLEYSVFGVTVIRILVAIFVVAVALAVQFVLVYVLLSRLSKYIGNVKSSTLKHFFDKLRKPIAFIIILMGIKAALYVLTDNIGSILLLGRVFWGLLNLMIFWIIAIVGDFAFDVLTSKFFKRPSAAINMIDLGRRLFRLSLVIILLLILMDLCGANVNAVLASLGIGGAALAFASKDTIANFFGSVSLVADRPFAIGDWIVAGDVEGVVEAIGIRSTRVRTFPKTVISIPNSILANESINNMSKMPLRRNDFVVGLTYSTTPDQILEVVEDIKKILIDNLEVDNNTFSVQFVDFGASSLDIKVVYYARTLGYDENAKTRQDINIAVMRAVLARGLSFAFPSRSLYFENPIPKA